MIRFSENLDHLSHLEQRRLAAIVFTDMVGYSSIAQSNEPLALELLQKHNSLLRSRLEEYQGREVKTIGDAFLLEFSSALEAVLCAIKIQSAFKDYNSSVKEDEKRIRVRIGIHIGDVILRDGDMFGDAVNIASRIVNFADEGGGICISEEVYFQVRNKIQYEIVKIPEQHLKHIDEPVTLYRIQLPSWKSPSIAMRRKRVAVLPFVNISPDPADSYFADGLTEELISALSEVRGLRVIARTSIDRYRNSVKDTVQIGSELNVSFLVEGSVRKHGNKIRVTAQLIEVESQEHIWSGHFDRDLEDIFSIQTNISKQIVDSLKVRLVKEERSRIEKKDTDNLAAYIAYLKGRTLFQDRSEKSLKAAREQFELAVREDPEYARAYAGLADIHMLLGDYLFAPVPTALNEAKRNIEKALELDPDLPEAHVSLGYFLQYEYKFAESKREFEKAIELNPSYATAHHWYASVLETYGDKEKALDEVIIAEELGPLSPAISISAVYRFIENSNFDGVLARIKKLQEINSTSPMITEALMAYNFAIKDWENALLYLGKMIKDDPTDPWLDSDLAYIYAVTGKRTVNFSSWSLEAFHAPSQVRSSNLDRSLCHS